MKAKIFRPSTEFYIEEGCYIIEYLNSEHDPACSIARARVEIGVTTQWHYLQDTVERYHMLSGSGVVEVGTLIPLRVGGGDSVLRMNAVL